MLSLHLPRLSDCHLVARLLWHVLHTNDPRFRIDGYWFSSVRTTSQNLHRLDVSMSLVLLIMSRPILKHPAIGQDAVRVFTPPPRIVVHYPFNIRRYKSIHQKPKTCCTAQEEKTKKETAGSKRLCALAQMLVTLNRAPRHLRSGCRTVHKCRGAQRDTLSTRCAHHN